MGESKKPLDASGHGNRRVRGAYRGRKSMMGATNVPFALKVITGNGYTLTTSSPWLIRLLASKTGTRLSIGCL